MKYTLFILINLLGLTVFSQSKQPVYLDKPFLQDYSIKYYSDNDKIQLKKVFTDRNGNIKVLSTNGLLIPVDGAFLKAGKLKADKSYRTIQHKHLLDIGLFQNQFVFLEENSIFSNAWAGSLMSKFQLKNTKLFSAGSDFQFLVSDGKKLELINQNKTIWSSSIDEEITDIKFSDHLFWVLTKHSIHTFSIEKNHSTKVFEGEDLTAFELIPSKKLIIIGTNDGFYRFDYLHKRVLGSKVTKLPSTNITTIKSIGEKLWIGTNNGCFSISQNEKIDYYNGERWLPNNDIIQISEGKNNSALILTKSGLAEIFFQKMTLAEKADFYEKQVRTRHIRNGFNASIEGMAKGDLSTGFLADSDNDGLWTSMYLGAEVFRYVVTKSEDALQNCRESLDAMERLFTINGIPGFPSRSFERSGYIKQLADPERWQHAQDKEWDWKSTTSSDEAIGHIFVYGAIAELINDNSLRKRSIKLIDTLMSHIIKNDFYLIDYDGKPTTWGKWNPSYVNSFPKNVGDRKLNSSNIVAMLQTAYHFTKKTIYKEKAFELMKKHGYFENLMRPMKEIGYAPEDADEHSKKMSDAWNHSDDEMYFLGYWGLYRYAFNDTLKAHYKKAIIDHWQTERPEKEGLWNIFTALTGTSSFDLNEAAWYLREHPLDLIDWNISNSHRKDIEKLPENFRTQTIKEVLPPDERPIQRHNANMFNLDRMRGNGTSEHSAGDIWLLPYWLGRYLGVISPPQK
ncbi:hypothetical protein Emtol_4031 [Emticicia oligotrophica DSM 17448]|uniref:Uncharacterized protein n=1 Tax=Emticicia oligotrophica (strain DSM 17448 / CIP 109782 / MTCC 6937 / GPTSA100-15) TaxID=929562 RepID=A0ABM5N6R6_EMTOG|nr:hypothetical protein [Emticicia oligotrophica]AFK05156.1 hypothetical protein Emtol_4031 [Emticicia oligotrophica DSM 17448]